MMKPVWMVWLASVAALMAACSKGPVQSTADVIYSGGDILTMAGDQPQYVEALAVKEGHILLAGTLAVALSTALMMLGGVAHPPGAATALLAVVGGEAITSLGFLYVPLVTVSAVLMVAVAVIVNNFSALPTRRYPAFKW